MKPALTSSLILALGAAVAVACTAPVPQAMPKDDALTETSPTKKPSKTTKTTKTTTKGDDDDDDDDGQSAGPKKNPPPTGARKSAWRTCMDACVQNDPAAMQRMDAYESCIAPCGGDDSCRKACSDKEDTACASIQATCNKLGDCQPTCPPMDSAPGTTSGGGPSGPTFTQLFEQFLGPNTAGHCSDCHSGGTGGFRCGSTKDSCFQGLVQSGFVDPANPSRSTIAVEGQSPLSWLGGNMPTDGTADNALAADAVKAWVAAGAKND
jgi:hypothetical protein